MFKLTVIGAGKIGRAIVKLLADSGDYDLLLADNNPAALREAGVPTRELDVTDPTALAGVLQGRDAVLSACGYQLSEPIARAAASAGVSYFDLTEDVATSRAIRTLAAPARSGQIFMPQCGLAPGFISILGHAVARQFDRLDTLKLRVGALPEYASNELMYNLTWSTEGLINEYCNPCDAIKHGERTQVQPLEGIESFSLDGIEYEAFNTSGGLGTLCETLDGSARELSYKTIRYRGHQYLMNFLINGLKLRERRSLLKKIFENAVAYTQQDLVLVLVTATGQIDGRFTQITDCRKIYHQDRDGEHWSAIKITTAGSACASVDLFRQGRLPAQGFVRQEQIPLDAFLANRFGSVYETADVSRRG